MKFTLVCPDEDVGDLPISRGEFPDGTPFVESEWQLSPWERLRLLLGGHIYLCCRGHTHPPVSIETLGVFPSKNLDGREVNDD